jgi:hypothetical protein
MTYSTVPESCATFWRHRSTGCQLGTQARGGPIASSSPLISSTIC